jgi:hypothetical protein
VYFEPLPGRPGASYHGTQSITMRGKKARRLVHLIAIIGTAAALFILLRACAPPVHALDDSRGMDLRASCRVSH